MENGQEIEFVFKNKFLVTTEVYCAYTNRLLKVKFDLHERPGYTAKSHGSSYIGQREAYRDLERCKANAGLKTSHKEIDGTAESFGLETITGQQLTLPKREEN